MGTVHKSKQVIRAQRAGYKVLYTAWLAAVKQGLPGTKPTKTWLQPSPPPATRN
jgi:hypothetical protein